MVIYPYSRFTATYIVSFVIILLCKKWRWLKVNNDEMLLIIKDIIDKNAEKMENKIGEVKTHMENKVEEVKNHMGVIAEYLKNDIKAIAEGHEILNCKIDELKNEIKVIQKYVIGADAKLNEHEIILKRAK